MKRMLRLGAALLVCFQWTACYTYREVARVDLRDGSRVRVMIQADEAVRQQSALGRLTQQIEGEVVVQQSPDLLGLTVAQPAAGPAGSTNFNIFLSVPWASVVRLEEKRFNTMRTLGIVGASAVIVIAALAIDGGGTANGDGDPGTDSRVRIPLIRIPVR